MSGLYFCRVLFLKNVDIFGKTAVFRADMGRLGKYHTGGYGRYWGLKG